MTHHPPGSEDIFGEAIEIDSPDKRAEFLKSACGDNAELLRVVEKLVADHFRAGSFLDGPSDRGDATHIQPLSEVTEQPGDTIGPYKLLQQIGEGGMGVVYMAEQKEPVRRRVALKIIKPGMDTRQVIARFEAERQALALMDHPNIAKVLDAGTTETGRPFFVMELVIGVPLTDYCDERRLTPKERLELFVPVCQAVQHAHQKGIIHRDLKPSNLLVAEYDQKPVPKVIDFGVAKATNQTLTEKTMFTQLGQIVGTLDYMSPEQARHNQLDVDTRSDIYSLGVILYELLTGETPFDRQRLRSAAFDELLRIIREEEPPRPSTRLSTSEMLASIAANRKMEPNKLSTLVRGELDWIVMKALDKERGRRYETAGAFAADVQRYLDDEAVIACPPSAGYRFHKFVRRNRGRLAFVACLVGMLIVVGATALWTIQDRNERRLAVTQRIERILDEADQAQQEGRLRAALVEAERAAELLNDDVDMALRSTVERRSVDLRVVGELERVRLAWQSAESPEPSPSMIEEDDADGERIEAPPSQFTSERAEAAYAAAFRELGFDVDALSAESAGAGIRDRSVAAELVTAIDHWALVRRQLDDDAGSDHLLAVAQEADPDPWRRQLRELSAESPIDEAALMEVADTAPVEQLPAATAVRLAEVLNAAGLTEEAVAVLRRAYGMHPNDFWIAARLGNFSYDLREDEDAVRFCTAAIAVRPDSPDVQARLGNSLSVRGNWDEGVAACRHAVRLNPQSPFAHASLAFVLFRRSSAIPTENRRAHPDLVAAEQAFRAAIQLGSDYLWPTENFGSLLATQERWDEAETVLRDAIRIEDNDYFSHYRLGHVLRNLERWDEAILELRRSIELDPTDSRAYYELALVYQQTERWEEFLAIIKEAVATAPEHLYECFALFVENYSQVEPLDDAQNVLLDVAHADVSGDQRAWGKIAEQLEQQRGRDAAISAMKEAIFNDPESYGPYRYLNQLLAKEGRLAEATWTYEWMLAQQPSPVVHFGLADALSLQGESARAIDHYQKAIELDVTRDLFTNAHVHLANLLAQSDNPDERDLAVEYGEQAFALRRTSNWNLSALAFAQFRAGQWEGAAASYRMLSERQGDETPPINKLRLAVSLWHVASVHNERGESKLAAEEFTAAAGLYAERLRASDLPPTNEPSDQWMDLVRDDELFASLTRIMPDDYRPWAARARAFALDGEWDQAAADYVRALELVDRGSNREAGPQMDLALLVAEQPQVCQRVIALRPDDDRLLIGLIWRRAAHGDWQQALNALEVLISLDRRRGYSGHQVWIQKALLQLELGELEGYQQTCEEILDRWPRPAQEAIQERTVTTCLLIPDVMTDRINQIVAIAEDAVAVVTDATPRAQWLYLCRGLAAYRVGEFDVARRWLEKCVPEKEAYCEAAARLVLAMCDECQGRSAQARQSLEQTLTFIGDRLPHPGSTWRGRAFYAWIMVDILRREAKQTLGLPSDDESSPPAADSLAWEQFEWPAEVFAELLQQSEYPRADLDPHLWTALACNGELFQRLQDLMPDDYRPWAARARMLASDEQWDQAATDYSRALELVDAEGNRWWGPQAHLAVHIAQRPQVYDRVLAQRPDDLRLMIALARHRGSHGRWQEASEALATVIEADPRDFIAWHVTALLQLQLGDQEAYRRACNYMLDRWSRAAYKPMVHEIVRACLLTPDVMADRLELIRAMADDVAVKMPEEHRGEWFDLIQGLVAFRAGDLPAVRTWLEKPAQGSVYCQASARLILALVEQQAGRAELARDAYRDAVDFSDSELPELGTNGPGLNIHYWLICDILRREAEQTLGLQPDNEQTTNTPED